MKNIPFNAPLVASLAVADTLNSYLNNSEQRVRIKWINDLHYMNKKVSGTLCQCENADSEHYLTLGIGVNLNQSPVPDASTCLKEILGSNKQVNVDEFVERLSLKVVEKFSEVDRDGFEGKLRSRVTQMLEYKDEEVNIFDATLTNVLHRGVFTGINKFGHA